MKPYFRSLTIAALTLCAGVAAQAQTGQINSGTMTMTFSPYLNNVLSAETVTSKFVNYDNGDYKVTSGTATAASGISLVQVQGGLTFKAKKAKVQLQALAVDETGATPYVTADVIADGTDMGRYPIFQIVSADPVVVTATGTPKKTTELQYNNIQFTINPDFFVDFMDYLQFQSFDASQVLGTIAVDVVVKK